MKIYYDIDLQSQVEPEALTVSRTPVLYYGTAPEWEIYLLRNGEAADVSGITSWRAAVDADFNRETAPVCRTADANINATAAATGVVKVLLHTTTTTFQAALNGAKQKKGYFELQGINADGYADFIAHVPIILHAAVDPIDTEAQDPDEAAGAVSAVSGRVTALENTITVHGETLTDHDTRITVLENNAGGGMDYAASIASLNETVADHGIRIDTAVAVLNDHAARITELEAGGGGASDEELQALTERVAAAEGSITVQTALLTDQSDTLTSHAERLAVLEAGGGGASDESVTALDTRLTAAESSLNLLNVRVSALEVGGGSSGGGSVTVTGGGLSAVSGSAVTLAEGAEATANAALTTDVNTGAQSLAFTFGIPKGDTGEPAGFGTPTATVAQLAEGASPTVSVTASGSDTAKVFKFTFGIPKGDTGEPAGFGTPTASVTKLAAGANPTVSVTASGANTSKVFKFTFGIPKGDAGEPLEANYVDVSGLTGGFLVIEDVTVPVQIEIGGVLYDVESGWVEHVGNKFYIDPAPFLAAADLASFTGTWRVWRAGGKCGLDGGAFPIQVVSILPENPDSGTLYLIPEA